MKKIVIIGASVAGHSTAVNLRERDQGSSLTLISDEPYRFYDRRRLADFLAGRVLEEELYLCGEGFYIEHNINFLKEKKVTAINPKKKTVSFKDKETLGYDFLIIASGRKVSLPDIPGIRKEGVVTLGALKDFKDFKDFSSRLILDTVCVASSDERALAIAGVISDKYKVEVINGQPLEIIGEGQVQAVKLKEGKVIGVSAVIFVDGFESSIDFLKGIAINMENDFIVINEQMRTNIENIFACGAVCGRFSWDEAVRDSAIIAENIVSL
jgi:NAD(P)H-nitrite reductase large subunit